MVQSRSPKIQKAVWGQIQVDGFDEAFSDAKLYPGGASEWDWRLTGTHHVPGIQPEDVKGLINYNPTVVILSKGFWERLQVKQETKEVLTEHGILVHILETSEAVDEYNHLVNEHPVAGLFHSTC